MQRPQRDLHAVAGARGAASAQRLTRPSLQRDTERVTGAPHRTTGMDEASRELILRLHERLFATSDLATIDEFFAEEFVSHNNPPGFPDGVAGVKRFFGLFRDAFPDVEVRIDELVAEGDRVAVATTIIGTHDRELLGVPPTGRKVSVTGIDIVRVANGKIVEHRGLTDTLGLMRQLSAR
jgi:steroid delta-isomerase-like uncharacterized protein